MTVCYRRWLISLAGLCFSNLCLSLDVYFENKPLQEVLPWLAAQLNESVVISPDIDRNLTLSIKDASWQDVLEAVARQPGIRLQWQSGVAVLMPDRVVDKVLPEPDLCQRSFWPLKHAKAEGVGKHLQTLYPSISIVVDLRTNSLLGHYCAPLEGVEEVIAWLDSPLKQIEISAQIAQVSRSAQSQFGVNWQSTLSQGVRSSIGGAIDLGALAPTSEFNVSATGANSLLSLTLDMLESEGMANVVSKPKIVTSTGQTARIESGTEIPYQTVSDDTVSVSFRQAALMLEVTPYVKQDDYILLELSIHQDSVGDLVNGVPSLKTNRLTTQVMLKDQETLVLGGVFREESFTTESRVPLLSSVPWLGELFKSHSKQQEKVELLVFITPKLLQMTVN
ncbi:type II and III secretion system protein [Marinomonas posidonica]|uniref:Type II and III secretion system protein n=1 Tax=Marinomonas posidonica (strain CECT 7376 / NCIMB 14433 / IVIA-Po-181) TaxID=491952 RepID=F6CT75_MARPP|nr:type II and III secretion system protein [Marinomonas posidonica]AEF56241.1 type II and III secretion system protein [Marinomonas posidonica IVIA-Po-181]